MDLVLDPLTRAQKYGLKTIAEVSKRPSVKADGGWFNPIILQSHVPKALQICRTLKKKGYLVERRGTPGGYKLREGIMGAMDILADY